MFSTPWRFVNLRLAVCFCFVSVTYLVLGAFVVSAAQADPKLQASSTVQAKKQDNRLFGSIELRGKLSSLKQWTKVRERNKVKELLKQGAQLNAKTSWDSLKAKLMTLPRLEQIKEVHKFWNRWPYREDPIVYKVPDYWASPFQFSKNSGDCEDYAIAKYYTLRELGVPADIMRVVVLTETIRNIAHAVLAVYIDGKIYILDNLSRYVMEHNRFRSYLPHYSFNENNRWVHVKPKAKKRKPKK